MAKYIVIVAAALMAYAVYNQYQTVTQLKDTKAELETTQTQLSSEQSEHKSTKEKLAAETKEKEDAQQQAKTAQTEMAAAKTELVAAQTAANNAKAELTKVKADNEAIQRAFDELNQKIPGGPDAIVAEVNSLKDSTKQLTADLQSRENEVAAAKSQIAGLQQELSQIRTGVAPPGVTGRIVAINSQWNFVVLNVGKRDGVLENAELTVMRGPEPVAKLRIARADDNTSVADLTRLVAGATPPSVGDTVISN